MTAGARYGYLLVWVVVLGNVMAWLIQYLSAKLGIVTGQSLPETLGHRIRNPWARRAYWLQAELVAMATDIAEVIGGAVALNLLFGVPLLWGGVITGTVSIVLLVVQSRRGPRTFEFVVIGLVAIIAIGFTFGVFIAPPDPAAVVARTGPPLRRHRVGAAGGIHPRRDDHAARDLRAQRARARPLRPDRGGPTAQVLAGHRRRPCSSATPAATARSRSCAASRPHACCAPPSGTSRIAMLIAGTVNLCILLLAAANLAGVDGHRHARGRVRGAQRGHRPGRRDAVRGRPARERPGLDLASARTRAPRSCTACCTSASRSSPAGSSR